MKMGAVPVVDLPAGKRAELKLGGFHLMLMDLKAQVVNGSTVPITLVFRDAKGVESRQNLRLLVASGAPAHKH